MFRRVCLSLLASAALSSMCYAQDGSIFATEKGSWINIYVNDFVGMRYAHGITKHAACVSAAKTKANEFREKGLGVQAKLLMNELAAFEATGDDKFLIYCNANGVLLISMLVSGANAEAMVKGESIGTPARSGEAAPTVSRTVIDVNTGKATTTTVTPNN